MDLALVLGVAFGGGVALFALKSAFVKWRAVKAERAALAVAFKETNPLNATITINKPLDIEFNDAMVSASKQDELSDLQPIIIDESHRARPKLSKEAVEATVKAAEAAGLKGVAAYDPRFKPVYGTPFKSAERYYFNAVVRDAPGGDIKPVVWTHAHAPDKSCPICEHMKGVSEPQAETTTAGAPADLSPLDVSRLRAENKARAARHGENDLFRPKDGTYKVRLLPAGDEKLYQTKSWFVTRRQHYLNNLKAHAKPVQCLKTQTASGTWEGDCPICDQWKRGWALHSKLLAKGKHKQATEVIERIRHIKAMERYYYNVLIINDDGSVEGPLVYSGGKQVHEMLMRYVDKEIAKANFDEDIDLLSLTDGNSINFTRTVRHGYPSFYVQPVRKKGPLGTDSDRKRWMGNLWDLEHVAAKWQTTVAAAEQAMADVGFKRIRTCEHKTCPEQIVSVSPQVRFCSEECEKDATKDLDKGGCPFCHETRVNYSGVRPQYECGYASMPDYPLTPCKNRPACKCGNKTLKSEGCQCGSQSVLVDPHYYATHGKCDNKACRKPITGDARFCTERCRAATVVQKETCPECGENESNVLFGTTHYRCGYELSHNGQLKVANCKTRKECICRGVGCHCLAKSSLVAQPPKDEKEPDPNDLVCREDDFLKALMDLN
jgi:hypothetical protein